MAVTPQTRKAGPQSMLINDQKSEEKVIPMSDPSISDKPQPQSSP